MIPAVGPPSPTTATPTKPTTGEPTSEITQQTTIQTEGPVVVFIIYCYKFAMPVFVSITYCI